jgi:hypothetical protein
MTNHFSFHIGCLYDIAVTGTEVVVTETLEGATAVFHLTAPVTLTDFTTGVAYEVQPGPTTTYAGVADSYGFTIDTNGDRCDEWGTVPTM